ncbi:MAG: AsmA protein [Rhizobiales bacterium]|nr:AsmA protein [Hyphomicrobiales bacterium]
MLALTAALIGPYFIDWTSYRADFEREASRILGRQVKVEGAATARILPFPSVTFSDVRVAGADPSAPAMTVDKFSMDAELAPFLRGEVLIFDMRLDHPHVTVTVGEDGTVDLVSRAPALFDPRQVTLEKVAVKDGEITVHHRAGGRTYQLSHIDADISATSLAGPWRFDGTLQADGEPVTLSLSTGRVDEDGHMRVRVRADPRDYPIALQTDGDIGLDKGVALYKGDFHLDIRNAEAKEQAGNPDDAASDGAFKPKPPAPYRLTGNFRFDDNRLSVEKFRFETGPADDPYTAEGNAFLDIGRKPGFGITANGSQVRFDDALGNGDALPSNFTLRDRIAAFERVVRALPKPGIPGKVDLNLPAIVTGDTTVREVKLSAEPSEGGWKVGALDATLPGRTTLEANGFLRTGNDFGFSGSLLLAVAQPSGFAAWVAHDVDEAIRRLPAAGFQAKVDISPEKQVFSNLELILGDARFKGTLENDEPADANPSMMVKLDGGKLDVEGLAAFASLFISDKGRTRLADHDIDLSLKAGPVMAAGLTASAVDAGLRLSGGQLEIDRLSIDGLAGATISATGEVKNLATAPTGNIDASVVSVDLAPLVSLLAKRFPANPLIVGLDRRARDYGGLLTDAEIDVVGSAVADKGGQTGIALSAHGRTGGSHFTASASGKGSRQEPDKANISLNASLSNDEAAPVYALFGLPALPIDAAGRVEVSLAAKGSLVDGIRTSLAVAGEGLQASFDGKIRQADDGTTATGDAKLAARDIQPWLITAGVGLPGMEFGLPVTLASKATLANGSLDLDGLKGFIGGGAVAGNLKAGLKDGRPDFSGSLSADTIDLSLAADMLFGSEALRSKNGGWPETPFNTHPQPAFTGDLDLAAKTLQAGPLATVREAKFKASLDANGLSISDLAAKTDGGKLSGLFELRNNGGTGLFSGQMKLDGADLGQLLAGTGLSGSADLSASVTANGKSLDGMVASLAGSGTSSFRGLTIPGIDTNALPAILAGADRIGKDINADKTAAFAPSLVSGGRFAAGEGTLAFTLAEGVLRAPPIRLEDKGATVTVTPSFDFNKVSAAAGGSIAYNPGDEALVGSEPDVNFSGSGPFDDLKFVLDTAPLGQFLTQRALEREEARVEAMQAALLEKQRLRREMAYYEDRDATRKQLAEAAQERAAMQTAAREAAKAEAARQAEEARRKADAEAKQKAIEEAKAAAAVKAAEEARQKAEAEAAAKAEEEAKRAAAVKAAAEAAQQAAEEARQKAEAEAKQKAADEAEKARKQKEDDESLEDRIRKLLDSDKAGEGAKPPEQKPDSSNKPAEQGATGNSGGKTDSSAATENTGEAEEPAHSPPKPAKPTNFKDLPGVSDIFRQDNMKFKSLGTSN